MGRAGVARPGLRSCLPRRRPGCCRGGPGPGRHRTPRPGVQWLAMLLLLPSLLLLLGAPRGCADLVATMLSPKKIPELLGKGPQGRGTGSEPRGGRGRGARVKAGSVEGCGLPAGRGSAPSSAPLSGWSRPAPPEPAHPGLCLGARRGAGPGSRVLRSALAASRHPGPARARRSKLKES